LAVCREFSIFEFSIYNRESAIEKGTPYRLMVFADNWPHQKIVRAVAVLSAAFLRVFVENSLDAERQSMYDIYLTEFRSLS
jgi:predicted TIM-barrel fold metal-dependent hydrolase